MSTDGSVTSNKAQKLSSAKRKLKEFKRKKHAEGIVQFAEARDGSVDDHSSDGGTGPHLASDHPAELLNISEVSDGSIQPILSGTSYANSSVAYEQQLQSVPSNGTSTLYQPTVSTLSESTYAPSNEPALLAQIDELRSCNFSLQQQILNEREAFNEQIRLQVGQLREQMQVHTQTIAILVGEKSQLQAALTQAHMTSDNRQSDSHDLSGRLAASRQRVADLEKQLTEASEEIQKAERRASDQAANVERFRKEIASLNASQTEWKRRVEGMQERLAEKEAESQSQANRIAALKNELDTSRNYVEQLTKSESAKALSLIDEVSTLRQTKAELERQLKRHADEVGTSSAAERDQLVRRHHTEISAKQQSIDQLTARLGMLQNELEAMQSAKIELEKAFVQMQERLRSTETQLVAANSSVVVQSTVEPNNSQEAFMITKLSDQLAASQRKISEQEDIILRMTQNALDKESTISSLRDRIGELDKASADYKRVLASVEDVRTALSRALAQNNKLKVDYDDLQSAFVRVTNEKADMANELSSRISTPALPPIDLTPIKPEMADAECLAEVESLSNAVDSNREEVMKLSQTIALLEAEISTHRKNLAGQTPEKVDHGVETDPLSLPAPSGQQSDQLATAQRIQSQLEERFTKAMRERADLLDSKEQLEHLVVQLQGETETIGEYIALYHRQRSALRLQAEESARYLQKMTDEQKHQANRVAELERLVRKLVSHRSQRPARILSVGPDDEATMNTSSNGNSMLASDEAWPEMNTEDNAAEGRSSGFDDEEVDPLTSKILHVLTEMAAVAANSRTTIDDFGANLIGATNSTTPASSRRAAAGGKKLVLPPNVRRHYLASMAATAGSSLISAGNGFHYDIPAECPCCRGEVIQI